MKVSARATVQPMPWPAAPQQNPGRILAVDYGRKRIGLALSDELLATAQPLAILMRTNRQGDLRRLREICRKHGVSRVIVGHPVYLTGSESEMSVEASRFAARLRKNLGLAVDLVEERLTSWEARQALSENKRSSRRGRSCDDVAAAIMLRDYLHQGTDTPPLPDSEAR